MSLADYPYDALDDLLYDWFVWTQHDFPMLGYANADQAFALVPSPRQWQDTIEVIEESVRAWVMEQIEACVAMLPRSLRVAIHAEMLCRQGGASVWRPAGFALRPDEYRSARRTLVPLLLHNGVELDLDKVLIET